MKNFKLIFFAVTILFSFSKSAFSDSYTKQIYNGCSAWNEYEKNKNVEPETSQWVLMMGCKSFIMGWLASGRIDNIASTEQITRSSIGCWTSEKDFEYGSRAPVVSRLFVRYLDNNPKAFEDPIDKAMWETLLEAYTC